MTLRQRYLVLIALFVGMLPAALDQTIIDTALPHMLAELGGITLWGWVVAVYLLTSTAPVPVLGRLIDVYGRKTFFIAAVATFAGASVLCGSAPSMELLIVYRGIQGLGAGVIFPLGSIMIADIFPQEQRARAIGLYVGAFGLATVIGPQIGGLLVDSWGWRSIFYMNIPLGVIALTLALLFMREPAPRQRVPIDIAGAVLVTTGFALILLALQQGGLAWSWGSWQSIGAISGGAACLLLCFHVERRTPVPIFDLGLFRNTTFNILCGVAFLTGGVFTGAVLFVPWFLQGVIGTSASAAGGALTPMMLMLLVVAVISGFLSKHVTYRAQFIAGFGLLALALLLMSGFSLTTSWLYIAVTTGVTGAGAGFILPLLNVSIQHAFPQERHAVVISTTTFARAFGAAAGMTVFLAIFNYFMTAQFDAAIGPFLARLPAPVASGFRANFADHPLNMIQLLINPAATSQLPPAFQAPLLQAIRTMFLNSAYPVYLFGLGGCALGIALAALLGTARTTVPIYRSEASTESAWSTK